MIGIESGIDIGIYIETKIEIENWTGSELKARLETTLKVTPRSESTAGLGLESRTSAQLRVKAQSKSRAKQGSAGASRRVGRSRAGVARSINSRRLASIVKVSTHREIRDDSSR
ncbi:hypothetical protein EVAR_53416_1 [Eumeta japonica]|uniref:Uncharacterized protein n=1 Tax=Eumeta variegata TaxID=151549 RepID=A0A4C1XS60_EUMVA|nr:hypothetical protein EVAR_53416_1 [Eumeta japonica]